MKKFTKNQKIILLIVIFLATFLYALPRITHVNESKKEALIVESQTEKDAADDFKLVIEGGKPSNALLDEKHPLPADGGTQYYKGNGYTLEIKKTISDNPVGYTYGPIITFDSITENGKPKVLSDVRFYTAEDLNKLLDAK